VFCYEIAPHADGALLVVTYTKLTRRTAIGFLPGLHALLDRLDAQLAGRALPSFFDRFAALQAHYPEWSAHATAAAK
jgi:hypothetical protein